MPLPKHFEDKRIIFFNYRISGKVDLEHIRPIKSIFKIKLILARLLRGLYNQKNGAYIIQIVRKRRMYSNYIIRNIILYRKAVKYYLK